MPRAAGSEPLSHHAFAKSLRRSLTVGPWGPVTHEGQLYVLDAESNIWAPKTLADLSRAVAENSDGQQNCMRAPDYKAVAQHAVDLAGDEEFFGAAPTGLACLDTFYSVTGKEIADEPLGPQHRQRVRLMFSPHAMPTPQFDQFLHETFASDVEGREAEQIHLLQEVAGAIMIGIAARYQKAFLFHEPLGRAGKGVLEKILRALVPAQFVKAVSPMNWENEYYTVSLAGARLNVVGELPDDKRLPANAFKSILGGDLITGRHPAGRPIFFHNEAAHLFTSNHLPSITEQSEALFARWVTFYFPNSRLRSGQPLDPELPGRIITAEIAGIAHWALEGARRLLANGAYSLSGAHDAIITKWRTRNSSVEEFIQEECELGPKYKMKRVDFYAYYKAWCLEAGRKNFAKSKVFELVQNNLRLGIECRDYQGYATYWGLRKKEKDSALQDEPDPCLVAVPPASPAAARAMPNF